MSNRLYTGTRFVDGDHLRVTAEEDLLNQFNKKSARRPVEYKSTDLRRGSTYVHVFSWMANRSTHLPMRPKPLIATSGVLVHCSSTRGKSVPGSLTLSVSSSWWRKRYGRGFKSTNVEQTFAGQTNMTYVSTGRTHLPRYVGKCFKFYRQWVCILVNPVEKPFLIIVIVFFKLKIFTSYDKQI